MSLATETGIMVCQDEHSARSTSQESILPLEKRLHLTAIEKMVCRLILTVK
eukprot:m.173321 g.173321  ORF g.173321 m.173321 type:complete len:51 (-) comp16731_c0_seq27:433-585(-)